MGREGKRTALTTLIILGELRRLLFLSETVDKRELTARYVDPKPLRRWDVARRSAIVFGRPVQAVGLDGERGLCWHLFMKEANVTHI